MPEDKRIKLYGLVEIRLSLYVKIQATVILLIAAGSVGAYLSSTGPGGLRNLSYVFGALAFLESAETFYYLTKK